MRRLRLLAPAVLAACIIGPWPGQGPRAACHDIIGCSDRDSFTESALLGMSCRALAEIRNGIYAENGSCFRKSAWRATFSGRHCRHADMGSLALSRIELGNAETVRRAERAKGCGRG